MKKFRNKKMKFTDDELYELIQNENIEENSKILNEYIRLNGKKGFEHYYRINQNLRFEYLFEILNIDFNEYKKVKNKILKLKPDSEEIPLFSPFFKNHKGNYKLETLLRQHHDENLKTGIELGICYGKKFAIEDLQNNKYTIEDFKKMNKDDIWDYINENID